MTAGRTIGKTGDTHQHGGHRVGIYQPRRMTQRNRRYIGHTACALLIALSGCADKSPPLENAFCALYVRLPDPSDAVNLKKRENKLAILANEQTANECHSSGLVNGPR